MYSSWLDWPIALFNIEVVTRPALAGYYLITIQTFLFHSFLFSKKIYIRYYNSIRKLFGNTGFCLSPHFSSCLLSHLLLTLLKIGVLVIQARFSSYESRCLSAGGEKVQLCFLLLQQSFAFALNSTRFAFLQMFPKQVLNSGFFLLFSRVANPIQCTLCCVSRSQRSISSCI